VITGISAVAECESPHKGNVDRRRELEKAEITSASYGKDSFTVVAKV
jgi:hypothetical protein